MLITTDVGSTLGVFARPDCVATLAAIAEQHHGATKAMVAEVCRWFLHTAPELTEDLITEVCDYLIIPRDTWPKPFSSGFTAYPHSDEALAEIAKLAPVVAISNVSILTGPDRMADLRTQLGHHLDGIYPSYALTKRKPHPYCWQHAAERHARTGADIVNIVHIGDRIPEDIYGALRAGCRRAILTNTRHIEVPDHLHADPRIAVVPDLQAAVTVLHNWPTNPPPAHSPQ